MDDALANAVIAAYPLAAIHDCARCDRDSSTVARIETVDHVYWLKLATRTSRTLADLESEAEVSSELAERGVAVAPAVRRRDAKYAGMLALAEGEVAALLFEAAPGRELQVPTVEQAEALGVLLGRFHAVDIAPAHGRWRIDASSLALEPLCALDAWLERSGGGLAHEMASVRAELAYIATEMIAIARIDGLPSGLCHGDVHLDNVRFQAERPTLFDLEWCGIGPCAYDLACYWRKRIGLAPTGEEPPRAEWEALLRGYEQTRALAAAEHRAIPALAALRAIWVMAMPATPGATWGQDWIDRDYLDAHLTMIERLARSAR